LTSDAWQYDFDPDPMSRPRSDGRNSSIFNIMKLISHWSLPSVNFYYQHSLWISKQNSAHVFVIQNY